MMGVNVLHLLCQMPVRQRYVIALKTCKEGWLSSICALCDSMQSLHFEQPSSLEMSCVADMGAGSG